MPHTNASSAELAHFDELAGDWWDAEGSMRALHQINPLRLAWVDRGCGGLEAKTAVDVGCGAGILTESLALAGADALGIDLAEAALAAGRQHAAEQQVTQLAYRSISAEALAAECPQTFDVVTCMEMLEHVPDPASIVQACAAVVKPGGDVFLSTINRTPKAYALMIVGAEYLTSMVPRGTHNYGQFIRPSELDEWARAAGLQVQEITGMHYNPLTRLFSLGRNVDVNYLVHYRKPQQAMA